MSNQSNTPKRGARTARSFGTSAAGLGLLLGAAGCASVPQTTPDSFREDVLASGGGRPDARRAASTQPGGPQSEGGSRRRGGSNGSLPVPTIGTSAEGEGVFVDGACTPAPRTREVEAVVPPLALPAFIDFVFGEMLDVPYVTGSGVAARDDLVQLRSSGRIDSENFLELISDALGEYGVVVTAEDCVYQIIEDSVLKSRIPRFIRARATPNTPSELRPLVLFVELSAISANEMQSILTQAFPGNDTLKVEANQRINVVTLTGLQEDVDAALTIIEEMDELTYAGTNVEHYEPTYWVAGDLAEELNKLLGAEGWQSSNNPSVPRTVLILPIEFSNDLFIFAKDPAALARARFWLSQLDRPAEVGDVPQLFVYEVKNVDAELLATTLNAVLVGSTGAAPPPPGAAGPADPFAAPGTDVNFNPAGQSAPPGNVGGGVVVDIISNRIIYSGTASDYNRLLPLLEQLDQPPGEVLIQVSILEVTLTDETQYGIEFLINNFGGQEVAATLSNQGLGLGAGGLDVGILSSDFDVALNAFATNSQVNVLSRPRLVARSGSSAQIQVGTDVPVITSQRADGTQSGGGAIDILQSVEYRSTGVLLSIEPIIYSKDRVDLNISQEVSTTLPNTTSSISSPVISSRNINTQLSLEDGQTVVLGGLIADNFSIGETGIPLLKDIPLAGELFKNNSISQTRTELLVLISAYILRGREDKAHFTDVLVEQLNATFNAPDNLETLTPPRRNVSTINTAPIAEAARPAPPPPPPPVPQAPERIAPPPSQPDESPSEEGAPFSESFPSS
ncbi:MAG: secretin N-terminal domain-containing protein [Pseudomonadota bacterium]